METLEKRVERLETDLREIRTDVGVLKTDVAAIKAKQEAEFPAIHREMTTKADLNAMETRVVKWYFSTFIAMVGIVLAAIRFMR